MSLTPRICGAIRGRRKYQDSRHPIRSPFYSVGRESGVAFRPEGETRRFPSDPNRGCSLHSPCPRRIPFACRSQVRFFKRVLWVTPLLQNSPPESFGVANPSYLRSDPRAPEIPRLPPSVKDALCIVPFRALVFPGFCGLPFLARRALASFKYVHNLCIFAGNIQIFATSKIFCPNRGFLHKNVLPFLFLWCIILHKRGLKSLSAKRRKNNE